MNGLLEVEVPWTNVKLSVLACYPSEILRICGQLVLTILSKLFGFYIIRRIYARAMDEKIYQI